MIKPFAGIVLIAGGFYFIICLFAFLFQNSLVYFPTKDLRATPEMRGMAYDDVYFTTEDNVRLHGWYVPAEQPRGTVLFFHGNAGNISHRLENIYAFHILDVNVFIFDYRGYGESSGRVNEQGTYKDAMAAWKWLIYEKSAQPEHIILFGRSLGAGIASWLAIQEEVEQGGLVLESAFTSIPDLGTELYPFLPVRLLSRIDYPNRDRMPHINSPLLILHSKQDEIIPYHHGRTIYNKAPDGTQFFEMTGSHNQGWLQSGAEYLSTWDNFIQNSIE